MNNTLQRLVYLCHLKNELNRRRRRFYYHTYNGSSDFMSEYEARTGYKKAQLEMKNLTPEIKRICKELGAKLKWNCGGLIWGINIGYERFIFHEKFKQYHDAELFEMEVFNG